MALSSVNKNIVYHNADDFNKSYIVTLNGVAVDLSDKRLEFTVRKKKTGLESNAVINISTDSEIVVSGTDSNIVTFSGNYPINTDDYYHDLENTTDKETIMEGRFYVKPYNSVSVLKDIPVYNNDLFEDSYTINDKDGVPIDLSGKDLELVIMENELSSNILYTLTNALELSVSGVNHNIITITKQFAFKTDLAWYKLRNTTDDIVIMYGAMPITEDVTR